MRYELADRQDQEVISNPLMTNRDRNIYVIQRAPYKNLSAFEKFVKCLEKADPQSELATQLRQRMSKTLHHCTPIYYSTLLARYYVVAM